MKTPDLLEKALKFGINLGLDRMLKLLDLLGNPHKDLKVIHVAGTNGKGSVVTVLSSILAQSGKKVGIFTSPFLERFTERIRILDGREDLLRFVEDDSTGEIDKESLDRYLDMASKAIDEMTSQGYENPTEFEIITAVAFLYYKEQNVDVAVLETGLGGRLDSTNVIDKPLLTVITAIGLDHTEILGDTVGKIAAEKAGIFKPGVEAIVFEPKNMILTKSQQDEVREVLIKEAKERGAKLKFSSPSNKRTFYTKEGPMRFTCDGFEDGIETTLLGAHQVNNIVLAADCARFLKIKEKDIKEGIRLSRWKGRVEFLSNDPLVIMDGGHNPQGLKSLSDALTRICAGKLKTTGLRLLMGVMADKDVPNMLKILRPSGIEITEVYATTVDNKRSMKGSELCDRLKLVYNEQVETTAFDDAKTAAQSALLRTLKDGKPLLVTGSLYLVGEVRGRLKEILKEQGS